MNPNNMPNEEEIGKYESNYSEDGLFSVITKYAKKIGGEVIYKALQLFYVLQKPNIPLKAKATIIGALGYLISPIDIIPDFIPVLGFSDDAAAVAVALAVVSAYIDEEVNAKAKAKFDSLFGDGAYDSL
ncbi:MAG: YkvA family protein [Succinatimonas sp.]|nr:YkvA family protein [Succinatimonas sp.]